MPNKYVTGSGYFSKPNSGLAWFYGLWWENIHKYSKPEAVFSLAMGGHGIQGAPGNWINLSGDLGHVHEILNNIKLYPYCANGVAICTLALIAYLNECDFVYHEQDVLAFGPYVDKMYEEIGDGGLVMGHQKCQPCANSLMLIKHSFILEYVSWFLTSPPENTPGTIGEHKFAKWAESNPKVRYYSFGCDRDRPIPMDDPVFYAQKWNRSELLDLKNRGLVSFEQLPEGTEMFSNNPVL